MHRHTGQQSAVSGVNDSGVGDRDWFAGSIFLRARSNRGRTFTFGDESSGCLRNTAEPELGRILVAAKDLTHLADCYRRGVTWHAGQQQDAEDRDSGTESSTHHRIETPPGYFPKRRREMFFIV